MITLDPAQVSVLRSAAVEAVEVSGERGTGKSTLAMATPNRRPASANPVFSLAGARSWKDHRRIGRWHRYIPFSSSAHIPAIR
jgi:hypothetical protein